METNQHFNVEGMYQTSRSNFDLLSPVMNVLYRACEAVVVFSKRSLVEYQKHQLG